MSSWLAPAPSTRTRIFRRNRAGTCRMAAASTSLWSVKVFEPALPGRSSMARHSRVLAQPGAQRVEAVAFLPGGSRPFLVGAGGDQGGVHVDDQPAGQGLPGDVQPREPGGRVLDQLSTRARGLSRGRGRSCPARPASRPGPGPGAPSARSARPRAPGRGAPAGRCRSCWSPRARSPPPATPARCPGRRRATCPSSAAPRSAARSVPPGRRPCGAGPRRRGRPGPVPSAVTFRAWSHPLCCMAKSAPVRGLRACGNP